MLFLIRIFQVLFGILFFLSCDLIATPLTRIFLPEMNILPFSTPRLLTFGFLVIVGTYSIYALEKRHKVVWFWFALFGLSFLLPHHEIPWFTYPVFFSLPVIFLYIYWFIANRAQQLKVAINMGRYR